MNISKYITFSFHKIKNARKIENWKRAGYTFNESPESEFVVFWRINPRWLKLQA